MNDKKIDFSTKITVTCHPLYGYIKDSYIDIKDDCVEGICFDPENFNCKPFLLKYEDIDHVSEFVGNKGIVNVVDKSHVRYYVQAIDKEQDVVYLINEKIKTSEA